MRYYMNYLHQYIKNISIAQSINEIRTDMRSTNKCVAIYLYNKTIVSIGVNKCKTHPLLKKFNYHYNNYFNESSYNSNNNKRKRSQYPIHAELDGYIKLLNNGIDFNTLFVYRGDDCNMPSQPCHVCSNWIRKLNKLTVCYIDCNGEFISIDSTELSGHHRRAFSVYNTFNLDKY